MTSTTLTVLLAMTLSLVPATAFAQQTAARDPLPDDVGSLDGIMRAYYAVISGPAGEAPDRARDESLHVPGARVGTSATGPDGRPFVEMMTLGQFYDRVGGVRKAPFYEWELHRVTTRFGQLAHVWSTYASGPVANGTPEERGVNSIELYFDGTRWWIVGWTFDTERPGNPIPPQFLPAK